MTQAIRRHILRLMDSGERDEMRAAVATHQHLGADYSDVVAEQLVERIGREIDRRVDARLRGRDPARESPPVWASLVLAAGSFVVGLGATGIILDAGTVINSTGIIAHAPSAAQVALDGVVWVVVAAVNVAFSRRR